MSRWLVLAALALAACGDDGPDVLAGQRICGTTSIRGELAEAIPARRNGCGLSDGVRVFSVSGVRLSQPATMDCTTAKALDEWVDDGVKPAIGRRGGGLAGLRVMASYSCRTRNGLPGAKISEHGRGRAIDIGGFSLKDDSTISVLTGWRTKKDGPVLKKIQEAACGPFGTVLGPKSDVFHQNHFHLDTARYRSGAYCR